MDTNIGKKVFATFEDADRAAKVMRAKHGEPLQPFKANGGWVIGGRYLKSSTPYKRVKSFADIHALFDDLGDSIAEKDVAEYATHITTETVPSKVMGEGEGWTLVRVEKLTGRQLEMKNEKTYLVLTLEQAEKTLRIQMGGAFARHIPLVSIQATSLLGRKLLWHTWNPEADPTKWGTNKWFYMIEPIPDQQPECFGEF